MKCEDGQVDLTCNRIPSAVTECPASVSSATPISQVDCESAGCYYCNNLTPKCIEGTDFILFILHIGKLFSMLVGALVTAFNFLSIILGAGCARSTFTANDICTSGNVPINSALVCRLQGCSWCQNGLPGLNCYTSNAVM